MTKKAVRPKATKRKATKPKAVKPNEKNPTLLEFGGLSKAIEKYQSKALDTKLGSVFNFYAAKTITNASDSEVSESITDGSDDGQIDALFVDDGKVTILTCKYTEKFENTKKEFSGNERISGIKGVFGSATP